MNGLQIAELATSLRSLAGQFTVLGETVERRHAEVAGLETSTPGWVGGRRDAVIAVSGQVATRLRSTSLAATSVSQCCTDWAGSAEDYGARLIRADLAVAALRAYPLLAAGDVDVIEIDAVGAWRRDIASAERVAADLRREWSLVCLSYGLKLQESTVAFTTVANGGVSPEALDQTVHAVGALMAALGRLASGSPHGLQTLRLMLMWESFEALSPEDQLELITEDPAGYAVYLEGQAAEYETPLSPEWAVASFAAYMNERDLGTLSLAELEELAKTDPEFAAIWEVIDADPMVREWMSRFTNTSPLPYFSSTGAVQLLRMNFVNRQLAEPQTFDELDAADGSVDGAIDLQALDESGALPPWLDLAVGAPSASGVPLHFALSDRAGTPDVGYSPAHDAVIEREAVIANTVNFQAFGGYPPEAREFVATFPNPAFDPYGESSSYPIEWFTDDGVAGLATAALADTETLTEQVVVVAFLPESPGGVRNEIFTYYYTVLGDETRAWMNPGLPPDAVGMPGHTGINWFDGAAWASANVHGAIAGDAAAFGIHPDYEMRLAMADGNQAIFTENAIRQAMFLDAFPPGVPVTDEMVDEFFNQTDWPFEIDGKPRALFDNGDLQMRNGQLTYLAARDEVDPVVRQQLAYQGNMSLLVHDQAVAAPHLRSFELDGDNLIEIVGDPFDLDVTTWMVDPEFGSHHDDITSDITPLSDEATDGNLVIGLDLTSTLDPAAIDPSSLFPGVQFNEITGWEEVTMPGTDEVFPVSADAWHADYGSENVLVADGDGTYVFDEWEGPTTGEPDDVVELDGAEDLDGTAVGRITNYGDRMWYYANMFQQAHTDPAMVEDIARLVTVVDGELVGDEWSVSLPETDAAGADDAVVVPAEVLAS